MRAIVWVQCEINYKESARKKGNWFQNIWSWLPFCFDESKWRRTFLFTHFFIHGFFYCVFYLFLVSLHTYRLFDFIQLGICWKTNAYFPQWQWNTYKQTLIHIIEKTLDNQTTIQSRDKVAATDVSSILSDVILNTPMFFCVNVFLSFEIVVYLG